ncbi:SYM1 [Sergentomyia squamirostris]
MSVFMKNLKLVTSQYPVLRGMLAYSVIWPTAVIVQQTIAGKRWDTYDYKKCVRFCLYGTFFVAPTLYMWVRFSSRIWPATGLRTAAKKAVIEQFTYGPFAQSSFLFIMPLLEGRSVKEAVEDVRLKLPPTWKVAVCFWPVIQTINFTYVPERNRVPFVAAGSLVWTIFLAYMNQFDKEKIKARKAKNKAVQPPPTESSR